MSTTPNPDLRIATDGVYFCVQERVTVGMWWWKRKVWVMTGDAIGSRERAQWNFELRQDAIRERRLRGEWREVEASA